MRAATGRRGARIGVFGGSFDPPHVGHLLAASDAFETLALDRVLFVPASAQPLKVGGDLAPAPAEARLAMVGALVGADPRFAVERLEVDRGGLSFTVDTLDALGAAHPGGELVLLAGADVLATFTRWREPARIRQLATLAVLVRAVDGGADARPPVPPDFPGGPPVWVDSRRVDVSSTEIRARVAAGRPLHGFVPDPVAELIARGGWYAGGAASAARAHGSTQLSS